MTCTSYTEGKRTMRVDLVDVRAADMARETLLNSLASKSDSNKNDMKSGNLCTGEEVRHNVHKVMCMRDCTILSRQV